MRAKRYPTAQLPRTDRRFGAGPAFVGVVYVLSIVAMVVAASQADFELTGPGPGTGGGGGGGGGGTEIRYVSLPAMAAPAAPATQDQMAAQPEITLPDPQIETAPDPILVTSDDADLEQEIARLQAVRQAQAAANVQNLGPGSGTGVGPGIGSGSGGGVGSGQGTGIGSGVGPGSGGGEAVIAPEPRAIIYPFEDPPAAIRGRQFTIRFWVDARGRVTKVEIEPEIEDRTFRAKLFERMHSWSFYPALTADGRKVAGQLVITYSP